jgi:hypothetical protein
MHYLARSCGRPPLTCLFVISRWIHVSQNQPARIEAAPLARVDQRHAKFFIGLRDLSGALLERRSNQITAFVAVHRSWWLDPVQAELRVSTGRSDDGNFGDERLEQPGRANDQRVALEIENFFVTAHARAGAPRKNEASDSAITIYHCQSILRPRSALAQRSGGL